MRSGHVRYSVFFFHEWPGFDIFMTLQLGESEGNYGLDEEERDTDDENIMLAPVEESEDALRETTPLPEIPPPTHFEALSIEEQFEYVKPILVAILKNNYTPVRSRHEAFMGSAASRQKVINSDHDSGKLKGYELDQLGPLIRQWVRRRQARQHLGVIPADTDSDDAHESHEKVKTFHRVAS